VGELKGGHEGDAGPSDWPLRVGRCSQQSTPQNQHRNAEVDNQSAHIHESRDKWLRSGRRVKPSPAEDKRQHAPGDRSEEDDAADPGVWSQVHDEGVQALENIANIRVPVIAPFDRA
jgi:hypothetical protein